MSWAGYWDWAIASVETRHSAAMALPTVLVIFRSSICLLLILSFVPTTVSCELLPERNKSRANKHCYNVYSVPVKNSITIRSISGCQNESSLREDLRNLLRPSGFAVNHVASIHTDHWLISCYIFSNDCDLFAICSCACGAVSLPIDLHTDHLLTLTLGHH